MRQVSSNGSLQANTRLQEDIGWHDAGVLSSVQVSYKGARWLVVVKAEFPAGPKVAFLDVDTFGRCLEVLAEYASSGQLNWVNDKYPPRVRRWVPS